MKVKQKKTERLSVLDVAIVVGISALFLAVAVPLVRGALLRQRTAECARKMILAEAAFDEAIQHYGSLPVSEGGSQSVPPELESSFYRHDIDWWDIKTDLGGRWGWYGNGTELSVVISGDRLSRQRMRLLDEVLDDGDLETGLFTEFGSEYHYAVRKIL